LIDFAIQTIKADEQLEYSEIKFFKNIRMRLRISDETILNAYPDIEMLLEKDIITDFSLNKLTTQFLYDYKLPQFEPISIIKSSSDNPGTK